MDLRAAAYVVLGRIDMTAGVQAHVNAAHDLPRSARRVVLFEDLHLELHVALESGGRAHREVFRVELKADVDDGLIGQRHHTLTLVMIPFGKISSGLARRWAMPCSWV